MDQVTTSDAVIFINKDNVIHIRTLDKAFIEFDQALYTLTIASYFCIGERKLILMDLRQNIKITAKARTLFERLPPGEKI